MRVVSCQRENWKIDTEQANELGFFCFSCRNPRGPGLLLKVDRFSTTEAPLFGLPLTSSTLSAGNVKRHDDPDNLPSGRRSSRPCPGRCKLPDTRRRVMHGGSKRYALGSKTQKVLLTCLCPEGQGKLSLSPKHSCSESVSVSRRSDYYAYLLSPHWKALRLEAFRRDGFKCSLCPSTSDLRGHHVRYRNPLTRCTVKDIQTLCEACHTKLHKAKTKERRKHRKLRKAIDPLAWLICSFTAKP